MQKSNNIKLHTFPEFVDERGSLVVWENYKLPFVPARTFMISEVPESQTRANHSVSSKLFLTAISGSVELVLDQEEPVLLTTKNEGVEVQENTYIQLRNFKPNTMLLVFAEKPFDQTEYQK
ncbi:FdtA/QdtA family cupin domain-containing protein [Saprospiraceae bacterium]|nr:FdtA/QdtA family cupin domain-containing protein [Saprospiraceae bacterium]